MNDEILKLILNRLDIIEDKLTQLDNDPYNLNEFFRTNGSQMPDGYTFVDSMDIK